MMTVGELASQTGLPASTLRYWESVGSLPPSARVGGQRRYGQDSIHRVTVLRLGKACEFRLDEMRHLVHGFPSETPPSRRWQPLVTAKRGELKIQIARLQAMQSILDRVSKCQCAKLADCARLANSLPKM